MKFSKSNLWNLSAILITGIVIATNAWAGGANGGGGFQYPNSRLLLKKVSADLANQILKMEPSAFDNFPKGLKRDDVANLIRNVQFRDDLENTRTNPDGDPEGLMFDYSAAYCVDNTHTCANPTKAIVALKAFFDTYRAIPMKQLAAEGFKSDFYKLTEKDIRQRLLHEVGHLLGVGIGAKDDANGDVFADRVLAVENSQFVRCDAAFWVLRHTPDQDFMSWWGFVLHRPTGKLALVRDSWQSKSWNEKGPIPPPDAFEKSFYYMKILDLIEANGKQGHIFTAMPESRSFSELTPSQYQVGSGQIFWAAESESYINESIDFKIEINMKSRSGVLYTVEGPEFKKGLAVPGSMRNVPVPLVCRGILPAIEFKDIQTR